MTDAWKRGHRKSLRRKRLFITRSTWQKPAVNDSGLSENAFMKPFYNTPQQHEAFLQLLYTCIGDMNHVNLAYVHIVFFTLFFWRNRRSMKASWPESMTLWKIDEIEDMHGCWRHFSAHTSWYLHNVSAFIRSKLNHDVRASRLLVCFVDEKASDQFDRYSLRQ